jgi:hypothetical protein
MRDNLLDLVEHTHDLGCIGLVKIIGTDTVTEIAGLATDKSVVLQASFLQPISDFVGTFGMPNLDKLKILLNIQEYRENADITVTKQNRNDVDVPVGLHFTNAGGDFQNDYRFMSSEIVSDQLKTAKMRPVNWNIEFEPKLSGITKLKMQAQANSEQPNFKVRVDNNNLKFAFGDHSTHAGDFVFESGITGSMKHSWGWPVKQVISILDLDGDKVMKISDEGAMQIIVNSGVAVYTYTLPAQSK